MPQVTGTGTVWNLPQYAGELFTADAEQTPFLSMIGGLTGGVSTNNFEFPTAVLYDYPAAAQPAITETASLTAPTATHIARSQDKNVVQIFQEAIDISYVRLSNSGRMSGLNTVGQQPNPAEELAWQISRKLVKVARDVEYSFINGTYQPATSATVANKTRGILELITGNVVTNGTPAALTKAMLQSLYKLMADNGAYFDNMVLFTNSKQKQVITEIYASQSGFNLPATRNVGGMNIQEIETDFFKLGIVWNRFVPQDQIFIADVAHCAPVFQPVPQKGNFFLEQLAKTGASEKYQLFGQIGLAHGASFLHGKITGIL